MSTFLLGIYIALIFIRPMDWWPPLYGFQLVTAAAVMTLLSSFQRILYAHLMLWRGVPELRLAVYFLVGAALSWCVFPFWLTGAKNTFIELGKIILLYFLILVLARQPRDWTILLWMIMGCIAWMAVHGILQIHRGYGFGNLAARQRPHEDVYQIIAFGIFEDPNDLCAVFVLAVPLLWGEIRATSNVALRIVALALVPLVAYGAWLTNSRGGVMGIFGMFVALGLARTKGKFRRWIMAIVAISLVTVVAPSRFGKGFGGGGGRLIPWGDGIAAWKVNPIFGVGYGNFGSISSEEKAAHNSYIQVLTELGIVGYIPFIMLIYITMLHLRRAINLQDLIPKRERLRLSSLFSGMVGYLVTIYFISRQYNHVLYIMLGMCGALVAIVCRDQAVYDRVIGPWRQDYKRGLRFAILSMPFLYITVKIGYALGTG